MIVVDASIVLKWFAPDEEGHSQALVLRDWHVLGRDRIVGPDLLWYEVANILRIKRGGLSSALEAFSSFCIIEVEPHPLGPADFARAMEFSTDCGISTYDASYVALSQRLRCRFVTADERLLARLKGITHVVHLKEIAK